MASIAQKKEAAKKALRFWHNRAVRYSENYDWSFDKLISWMDKSNAVFLENFGDSALIVAEDRSWLIVQEQMENLADSAQGRLPQYSDGTFKSWEFSQSLVEAVATYDWARVKEVTGEVYEATVDRAKTVVGVAVAGGVTYYLLIGGLSLFALAMSLKKK